MFHLEQAKRGSHRVPAAPAQQHGEQPAGDGVLAFLAAHRFYEKNGFSEIPQGELPPPFR